MSPDGLEAIVFDFDGVIIDTETPEYLSWREVFRSYGARLDWGVWSRLVGTRSEDFDLLDHLEKLVGRPVDRRAVEERRRQLDRELIQKAPLLPGVLEYLREARRLGLRLGVASSSSRRWVVGHLEGRGLLDYFDVVRTAEDVARVKPDPELYVSALEALGAPAERAVAIEDSPNGIAAARGAGLVCVAVPNPITRRMDLGGAHLRLESLAQLPLPALLERIAALRRKGS